MKILEKMSGVENMKYETLTQVKAAYESGELNLQTDFIMIDNDSTVLDAKRGEGEDDFEQVFDGDAPSCLLEEALTLLGIPWDNA